VIALDTGLVEGPDEGRVRTFPVRVDPVTKALEILVERQPAFSLAAE
jgi:nitrite reductase (NADH) small subunit